MPLTLCVLHCASCFALYAYSCYELKSPTYVLYKSKMRVKKPFDAIMDKPTALRHVKQYADIVRRNFKVKKIILYGSHSKNAAREHSDIDVAIVLDRVDGDFLSLEAKLFRLRREIDARIEPVLLEESNDRSGFLEEILKTGEVIYSSE